MPPNVPLVKVVGTGSGVVLLNNAATTPPFESTLKEVADFMQTYGALHRGAGPHAALTYLKTKQALLDIRSFIGTNPKQELLFTTNTSNAINLFIRLLDLKKGEVILTSLIEHTSNHLPWRHNTKGKVVYVNAFDDGSLDYQDLEKKARLHRRRLKLIAITGASNLSGYVPDIHRIAVVAHKHKAMLFVDAAQLAPHRPIDLRKQGIDVLAFSAHKMYAPFGLGVLALPKVLLDRLPVDPGGGSIDMISDKDIVWAPAEVRHQTGTWNVAGIIAAAASCKAIRSVGWKHILAHEAELVRYAAERLPAVPGLTLYVDPKRYVDEQRIGTFVFNLKNYHHALLSAILEHEYKIETRAGTICNHKLVRRWMKVGDKEQKRIEREIRKGNRLASYGIVRASLGIHNTKADIDALVDALTNISLHGTKYAYKRVPREEVYELDN